jgi:phosphoenolpyruvate carboxykinase (ATP)
VLFVGLGLIGLEEGNQQQLTISPRPNAKDHTEIEEELHDKAHIDYDRVAIVRTSS